MTGFCAILIALACGGSPQGPEAPRRLSIELIPVGVELGPGESLQFRASLVDDQGNTVPGKVTWTASGGTIGEDGLFVSGPNPGAFSVIAQSQSGSFGVAAAASVIVVPAIPVGATPDGGSGSGTAGGGGRVVTVSPRVVTLTPGSSMSFSAKVSNRQGKALNVGLSWQTATGSISPSGFLTAGSQFGEFEVSARAGNDRGTAKVKVVPPGGGSADPGSTGGGGGGSDPGDPPPPDDSEPTSIRVEPEQAQLLPGDVLQFSATVFDAGGNPVAASIAWSGTGGSIDTDGRYVAGASTGEFAVTASSGSLSATATVTISSPPPPSGTEIFPGQSIQSAVDAHPAGTAFVLKSGVHRRQSVRPKNGNEFVGEPGAVMDGEGATEFAFRPTANDVKIIGLTIKNYNNPLQRGAIHAGGHDGPESSGWVVRDNEIAYNAGGGVRLSNNMRVIDNHIHHNGQIGIVGQGDGSLVEGNEISYNNTRGIDPGWEAGGTKFVLSDGLVVRGNHVHHNDGPGLWTDINNINIVYEDNLVEHNTSTGIFHEISYRATIRNNTVRNNGHQRGAWLYGAGILVAHSSDVEVYGNLVQDNYVGIAGIDQKRGNPSNEAHGPWTLKNLWVHDNDVRQPDQRTYRVSAISREDRIYSGLNLRFDHNTYRISSSSMFDYLNRGMTTGEWSSSGQDTNSTFQE